MTKLDSSAVVLASASLRQAVHWVAFGYEPLSPAWESVYDRPTSLDHDDPRIRHAVRDLYAAMISGLPVSGEEGMGVQYLHFMPDGECEPMDIDDDPATWGIKVRCGEFAQLRPVPQAILEAARKTGVDFERSRLEVFEGANPDGAALWRNLQIAFVDLQRVFPGKDVGGGEPAAGYIDSKLRRAYVWISGRILAAPEERHLWTRTAIEADLSTFTEDLSENDRYVVASMVMSDDQRYGDRQGRRGRSAPGRKTTKVGSPKKKR